MHLVQLGDSTSRRVALVAEPLLKCLVGVSSVYELALRSIEDARPLTELASSLASGDDLDYDEVYSGRSSWHLLSPIDVPGHPSRLLVAGTGLTHLGSAKERQAMHVADAQTQSEPEKAEHETDSMRMFRWGVEGGRPQEGSIGIAPEWFYKGDASVLRAPFEALEIPGHAEDGGEEAELAGIYLIDQDGIPNRIGFTTGNEFSDHQFEKRNYLNLAGSKLRTCSLGPELVIGAPFTHVEGIVRIERAGKTLWEKQICTGEDNMCHSLANLEHHHFKFDGHRQPGTIHVHFMGANALSFGDEITLRKGDVCHVQFAGFGRALRNPVHVEAVSLSPLTIKSFT